MAIDYKNLPRVSIDDIRGCTFSMEATKSELLDEKKRRKIIKEIRKGCKDRYFWVLLGKNEQTDGEWVCLQCATSKNIASEIAADIKCMLPVDENDDILWNSYFHKEIFTAQYARNVRCQKYRDMLEKFGTVCFVVIDHEEYLGDTDTNGIGRLSFAEAKFAFDTKSVYWKPVKDEYKALEIIERDSK